MYSEGPMHVKDYFCKNKNQATIKVIRLFVYKARVTHSNALKSLKILKDQKNKLKDRQ